MLRKTHLAIGLAAALYFSTRVSQPLIFIPVVLVASLFPDIDSRFSFFGKKLVARPVQMMTNHRGIFHSYTLAILFSLAIALVFPILALPFFIGYSFHLFADSFTPQGIKPFWPFKAVSKGVVASGGKVDKTLFYTFALIDLILLGSFFYSFFLLG